MLLEINDSKCTAYTVDSARGLIVIQTHLVLAGGKLVLQKNIRCSSNEQFHQSDWNIHLNPIISLLTEKRDKHCLFCPRVNNCLLSASLSLSLSRSNSYIHSLMHTHAHILLYTHVQAHTHSHALYPIPFTYKLYLFSSERLSLLYSELIGQSGFEPLSPTDYWRQKKKMGKNRIENKVNRHLYSEILSNKAAL